MRRILPAVALGSLILIVWPGPVRGTVTVGRALVSPVRVAPGDRDERPDHTRTPNAGEWLWDLLMDRLTIPLGPADQNIWPPGTWRGHWIAAAARGVQPRRPWDGRTRTENGFVRAVVSLVGPEIWAAGTSTRAAALERVNGTRSGGHACDFF